MEMTIDEAITRYKNNAEYERQHGNLQGCLEFKQLAKWLEQNQNIENTVKEIRELIKGYAPRPRFVDQKYLERQIAQETLSQIKAEFVMDEWVIGHISEILDKYDYNQRKDDRSEG